MIDKRYFKVGECVFLYYRNPHNNACYTEKTVQIPLGEFFINNFGFGITEIGNTMGFFGFNCGEVLSEQDAFLQDLTNKNIFCVYKPEIGNDLLNKIVSQAKNYLIVWPIGMNRDLDSYVNKSQNFLKFTMRKESENNTWVKDSPVNFRHQIDKPFKDFNGIACVTNLESLLYEQQS